MVRIVLSEGGVTIDGEEDNRRGRKLRPGDVVVLADGKQIRIS